MSMRNHQPCLLNRIARALLCLVFIHALIGKLTNVAGPLQPPHHLNANQRNDGSRIGA
jgi:hypothetical protein